MTVSGDLIDIAINTDVAGTSVALTGVLGIPAGSGPWPAVVVVHEAFGVNDEMRKQVRHLAGLGYLALMPNLFTEGGARKCLTATFRALRAGEGRAYNDIEAARRMLVARSDATGAIGIIGFCMGGGFALMAASRRFDASSVNYGMLPKELDAALEGACPIVASFGAKDKTLAGAAQQLEAALESRGIPHDVKEYPNAGHAYLNDAMSGPRALHPLMRLAGIGPNPESTPDTWRRIDAFFREHLVVEPA